MQRQRGFTLLEILVVLVLTGLISGILLQGLQQVFFLQRHFGVETFQSQQGLMRTEWFRGCINGLIPDHDDGTRKFRGTGRRLTGITTTPLVALDGVVMSFELRLEFNPVTGETGVLYGSDNDAPLILSWLGANGRFSYQDRDGVAHEEWPPFLGKKWPQLPAAILLDTGVGSERQMIVAVPKGSSIPYPRQGDLSAF